jgi:DNA-binding beta-propeller fold protein YncE
LPACSQSLEPIFDESRSDLVWPPAPAAPRIRYVGQLQTDIDLKRPAKPFEAIGDFLLGAKPPQPLYGPRSVVRSRDGEHLWVADPGGRCLHRLDLADRSYQKLTRIGTSPLLSPVGVCLGPPGMIYVCDSEGVTIDLLSSEDGRHIETVRLPEEIDRPVALSYNVSSEELFVVDVRMHDIKVIDGEGRLLRILGRRGSGPGAFNFPCAIAADRDHLWIVDAGNNRVQCITPEGVPVCSIGQAGDAPGDMALPKAVALDSEGHVYVVDARFENIQVFDHQGRLLLHLGEEGSGPAEFWLPSGIFIDATDRIWVCDSYNERIQVFDYLPAPTAESNGGKP